MDFKIQIFLNLSFFLNFKFISKKQSFMHKIIIKFSNLLFETLNKQTLITLSSADFLLLISVRNISISINTEICIFIKLLSADVHQISFSS